MKKKELEKKSKKNSASKTIRHIDSDDDDDDDEVENDIALIIRQLWNFLRKKQGNKSFQISRRMKIRKNIARKYLDDISATRQTYKCRFPSH